MVYECPNIEVQFPPMPGLFYLQSLDSRKFRVVQEFAVPIPYYLKRWNRAMCVLFGVSVQLETVYRVTASSSETINQLLDVLHHKHGKVEKRWNLSKFAVHLGIFASSQGLSQSDYP